MQEEIYALLQQNKRQGTTIPWFFIGWKKASGLIVKLEILADSKRSSATGKKCRCDKAKVLAIETLSGNIASVDWVLSTYDPKFEYKIGAIVSVNNFDQNRFNECAPGIHFFVDRDDAVNYRA